MCQSVQFFEQPLEGGTPIDRWESFYWFVEALHIMRTECKQTEMCRGEPLLFYVVREAELLLWRLLMSHRACV